MVRPRNLKLKDIFNPKSLRTSPAELTTLKSKPEP
jgi:hypothetical protein